MINEIYKANYTSPIGEIILIGDTYNLNGLYFYTSKNIPINYIENIRQNNKLKIFNETKQWLDKYFLSQKPIISELSIKPIGSKFMLDVWSELCKIQYGTTTTYGEIAKKIALKYNKTKMSAQAIGQAISKNPISIIIPCHRVIGCNNKLTGYSGGINNKIKLLKHEGINIPNMSI